MTEHQLHVVKKGAHLLWPESWGRGDDRYRGGEGTILDLSIALEADWTKGQEHKIQPLKVGKGEVPPAPTPIRNPTALFQLKEHELKGSTTEPEKSVGEAIEANNTSPEAKSEAASVVADAPVPKKPDATLKDSPEPAKEGKKS